MDIEEYEFHNPELAKMAKAADDLKAGSYSGGWVNLLNWAFPEQGTTPAAVNTFSLVQSITSPAALRAYIPANSTGNGTHFRIRAWGSYGITATPSTTISLFANGAAGTSLCVTASMSPATNTVGTWWVEAHCVVLTQGSSGTIQSSGLVWGLGATAASSVLMPTTIPAAATWNTTQANSINLCATWSASSVSNTYTTYSFSVEQLN